MKGRLAVALAGGAYRYLRSNSILETHYANARTKVVIVGAGFGGLTALDVLTRAGADSRSWG